MRLATGAILVLAATLTACGSVAAPRAASGPSPSPGGSGPAAAIRPDAARSAAATPGPASGTRAQAAALARQLLARLMLPPGAARLPQTPVPPALRVFPGGATPSLDQYRLYALTQPMAAAAAFLAAHVPPGSDELGTGGGADEREVMYGDRQVPAGIDQAQVTLMLVPAASGGSLLRADAQVTWYPPRTAAEYIDPARYHVLNITVFVSGRKPHTVRKVVTSQAFIARLAEALNRMQAEPLAALSCPAIFADYKLAFSVSRHSPPVVVVSANQAGCGGAGITVNGRQQPPLTDHGARVAALTDQVVSVAWQL